MGESPALVSYVTLKVKTALRLGFKEVQENRPADIPEAELLELIDRYNRDVSIHGILVQLPLLPHISEERVINAIDPEKDVDGFHPVSVGRLVQNLPGFVSCTPAGIIELLKRYDLPTDGKKAVVIGRSNIVGKPLAVLLARPGRYGNATVTLCHSHTPDLAAECRQADFIFAAIGKPRFVTRDMVKKGAVIIDVGINRTEAGLCGDVDFDGVKDMVSAITPVPGGVGPMTIAMLLRNTLQSWHQRTGYGL